MYTMIKKQLFKYWTHGKTINRSYRRQCETNKALLHLLDSLQKVKKYTINYSYHEDIIVARNTFSKRGNCFTKNNYN